MNQIFTLCCNIVLDVKKSGKKKLLYENENYDQIVYSVNVYTSSFDCISSVG